MVDMWAGMTVSSEFGTSLSNMIKDPWTKEQKPRTWSSRLVPDRLWCTVCGSERSGEYSQWQDTLRLGGEIRKSILGRTLRAKWWMKKTVLTTGWQWYVWNRRRQGDQEEPEVHQVTKEKAAGTGSNLGLGESGTDMRGKRETNEV